MVVEQVDSTLEPLMSVLDNDLGPVAGSYGNSQVEGIVLVVQDKFAFRNLTSG